MKWRRRPSPAMLVAILALFVAAGGGQATADGVSSAAKLVTGKQIKNGSIGAKDLSAKARRSLRGQRGPTGPIGPTGLTGLTGPRGLTGPKEPSIVLASGHAGPPGPGPFNSGACVSRSFNPDGLGDISDDVVAATASTNVVGNFSVYSSHLDSNPDFFTVTICNNSGAATTDQPGFDYVLFDVP